MRVLVTIVAALIVAFSISVCCADGAAHREIRPYVTITGATSRITERTYQMVTSNDEWLKLWFRHKGEDPGPARHGFSLDASGVPQIDFLDCIVIAIFQGKSINSAGLKAMSVIVEKDKMVLRYDDDGYQTGGPEPDGGAMPCAAYGFFVLPRCAKTVVIEENVCGRIGGDPVWKERAQMEVPKALPANKGEAEQGRQR